MAKEMKTRQELADLVLREARAGGKCADLHSVYVIGPVNRGHSNWDFGTSSDGPNLISGPCRIKLNVAFGRHTISPAIDPARRAGLDAPPWNSMTSAPLGHY
jgi:hypothetical protein